MAVAAPTARSRSAPSTRARRTKADRDRGGRPPRQPCRRVGAGRGGEAAPPAPGSRRRRCHDHGNDGSARCMRCGPPRCSSRRLPASRLVRGEKGGAAALSEHRHETEDRMNKDERQRNVTKGDDAPGRPTACHGAKPWGASRPWPAPVPWPGSCPRSSSPSQRPAPRSRATSRRAARSACPPAPRAPVPRRERGTGVGADGAVDAGPEGVTTAAHAGAPTSSPSPVSTFSGMPKSAQHWSPGAGPCSTGPAAAPRQSTRARASGGRGGAGGRARRETHRVACSSTEPVPEHDVPRRGSWRDGPGCRSARS